MAMMMMVVRPTFMPAVPAAWGLAPTARIEKPITDRSRIHHTTAATSRATKKPRCSCSYSCGKAADDGTSGEIGSSRPGR